MISLIFVGLVIVLVTSFSQRKQICQLEQKMLLYEDKSPREDNSPKKTDFPKDHTLKKSTDTTHFEESKLEKKSKKDAELRLCKPKRSQSYS